MIELPWSTIAVFAVALILGVLLICRWHRRNGNIGRTSDLATETAARLYRLEQRVADLEQQAEQTEARLTLLQAGLAEREDQ